MRIQQQWSFINYLWFPIRKKTGENIFRSIIYFIYIEDMQLDRYLRDRYSGQLSTSGGDWRVFISLGLTSRRGTKSTKVEERVMVVHLNNAILGRRVEWLWRHCLHAQICIAPHSIKLHCTE